MDPEWVSSVGGHDPSGDRWEGSHFGEGMDILAPGSLPSDGWIHTSDHLGNTNPPSSTSEFAFTGRTSSAAAHLSGVYSLLRSTDLQRSLGWHPEDFEGVVKASADRDVQFYQLEAGWGNLDAGKLYEMLTEDCEASSHSNYVVTHFEITPKSTDFGEWPTNPINIAYREDFRDHVNDPIEPGDYQVYIRPVEVSFELPQNKWDQNAQLYVWGRGNMNGSSGWGISNPNYQTGFTQVLSAEGGTSGVTGIMHDQSQEVILKTYQHKVYKGNTLVGVFPADKDVLLHFSAFGRECMTSIVSTSLKGNGLEVSLSPVPANKFTRLRLNMDVEATLTISNMLGNSIWSGHLQGRESQIFTGDLPNGTYLLQIKTAEELLTKTFIVVH